MSVFDEIQSAFREKTDLNARLSLIPYEGTDAEIITGFLKENRWNVF